MIKVIDNFIPLQYQKELLDVISSRQFLWTYQPCTIDGYVPINNDINDVPFLGRRINNNSELFPLIKPLVYFFMEHTGLNASIYRTKINCILPKNDTRKHPPHADATMKNMHTLLYYVNDSDGETMIFNEFDDKNGLTICDTVTPKMGRAVIFPSSQFHCGNNPTVDRRFSINIVLNT